MEISKSTRNGIDMPLVGFGTYQLSIDQASQWGQTSTID
jgi:hypothetical protein